MNGRIINAVIIFTNLVINSDATYVQLQCGEATCHFASSLAAVEEAIGNGLPAVGPSGIYNGTFCFLPVNQLIMGANLVNCGSTYTTFRDLLLVRCGHLPPNVNYAPPCMSYEDDDKFNVGFLATFAGIATIFGLRRVISDD